MIGESFGSYRVVRRLGQGGMGVVYVAEHTLLGKQAVVKQLLPELSQNQEIVQRFFNEARAATMIRHPGIVDVFDFGYHASGSAFIVMEFLPGESLAARLERERVLAPAAAVAIARQIAGAVGAAHAGGIVHRDLKPDNVYLVPERDAPDGIRVKVLDFGIAKLAGAERGGLKTRTGAVMGTPVYMSPEQCHGAAELDHRADVYSLGCILFELVCGRPPFTGEGLGEILGAHMFQPPPAPRTLAPSCPPALEAIILAMLAKRPDERTPSMEAVIGQLDQLTGGAAMIAAPALANAPPPPSLPPMDTAPRQSVTTLGGAAAQIAPTAIVRGSKRGLWIGLGAAAVAAIAIVAVIAGGGGGTAAKPTASSDGGGGGGGRDACAPGATAGCAAIGRALAFGAKPDPRTAATDLGLGCDAADPAACGTLARLLISGADGVPIAASRAVSLATTHCASKQPDACVALAIARRDGIGTSSDRAGAIAAATTACDAGDGAGCAIAAPMLAMAEDAPRAAAAATRAAELLDPRCQAGEPEACVALAGVLTRGLGPARDLARATALLQRGCDAGHADSCVRLARMYERGQGVHPDGARTRELLHAAAPALGARCDAGAAAACTALAQITGNLTLPDRDAVRADSLFDKACAAGDGLGCVLGADRQRVGDGLPRDPTAAGDRYRRGLVLLEPACQAGDTAACLRASGVLARGQGVQRDAARAIGLARSACRAGSSDGCVRWGTLDAASLADAFARALALAGPACDAGDLSACDIAGDVLSMGPHGIADADGARARYRTACDGGLAEACFDLAYVECGGAAAITDACRALDRTACDGDYGAGCYNLGADALGTGDLAAAGAAFERGCDAGEPGNCTALADLIDRGKLGAKDPDRARALRTRACILGADDACR